jgi:acid phosphatase (class A)
MLYLPKFAVLALVLAVTGGAALAADGPYLAKSQEPDAAKFLPAPPDATSPAGKADEAAFLSTRRLKGSPRWDLATHDANKKPDVVADDFSCAVGTRLGPDTTPHVVALIARLQKDASATSGPAKDVFKRTRPLVGNDAPVCEDRAMVTPNDSYPSGHTTMGWLVGLALAKIAPDRAPQIVARARVYGESRVVCGVHWVSDVDAGRLTGGAVFTSLQGNPAFDADMDAAKQEIAAARANPAAPDAAHCAIEAKAEAHQPW